MGNLGNETNDDVLTKAFARFPTFQKAKVVRDKKTNKTKGATAWSSCCVEQKLHLEAKAIKGLYTLWIHA